MASARQTGLVNTTAPHGRSLRSGHIAAAVGLLGIITAIAGSFLPWLVSGGVGRNSYQIAGLAERIGLLDGAAGRILAVWPWWGPVCLCPVVLGVLRLWRLAGIAGAVCGVVAAGLSGVVLVEAGGPDRFGIRLATAGPVTMLVGGLITVAAALTLAIRPPARRT